jgi:hypothetical protein
VRPIDALAVDPRDTVAAAPHAKGPLLIDVLVAGHCAEPPAGQGF